MIWFGSSTGVALSNKFREAKSVVKYLRFGWHVIIAYTIGFFILLAVLGWNPMEKRGKGAGGSSEEKTEVVSLNTLSQ